MRVATVWALDPSAGQGGELRNLTAMVKVTVRDERNLRFELQ